MTEMHDTDTPEWVARFLGALQHRPNVAAAARAAGIAKTRPYDHRKRDPHFAQAWDAVLAQPRPEGALGQQRARPTKLDRFIEALAATSNVSAAAAAAGLDTGAIYKLRRSDPDFERRWYAALAEGYDNLEMELLCRLRAGETPDRPKDGAAQPKFDTATALRCLAAHRESVAREKGRRTLEQEAITIASINEKIDRLRLREKSNRRAMAKAQAAATAGAGAPAKRRGRGNG